MTPATRTAIGLALAAATLVLDQASKLLMLGPLDIAERGPITVIPGLVDLQLVWNRGVTFGLFQAGNGAGPVLLAIVAAAVTVALLVWMRRAENTLTAAALGAIIGGALGNVVDRFHYGRVVDFVHLHFGTHDWFPYVFNLGDSAIVLGVTALLLDGLRPARAA